MPVYGPSLRRRARLSRQAFGDNETEIQVTLLLKLKDLDFADDMVLLNQKIALMSQKFEQAARVGLKVNATNTKEMRIWSPANTDNISCAREILKRVTTFLCLGRLITTFGGIEEDVDWVSTGRNGLPSPV